MTVEIPLINEQWQMPQDLRDRLLKKIFTDPYNINYDFYDDWYNELMEEDKKRIVRVVLTKPYSRIH